MNLRAALLPAALCTGLLALGAGLSGPPFAEAAPSGKSLVIPAAHKSLGVVYHTIPGRDAQVSFASRAPLENIDGNSNAVIGYAVAGTDAPAMLRAGEWHLPVKSLRTGNRTRDGHLAGEMWLDASRNPDIVFQLKEVADVSAPKDEGDTRTHTATLKGDMTIHGVTRAVEIPGSTIAFRKAGPQTEAVARGDLLLIRAKYDIVLSDYGVSNSIVGQKVAEVVSVDTRLVLSTVPPEEQGGGGDQPR